MTTRLKKGFTLIELLVVLVVIGILATIGVATFSGYFAKARDTERQTAIRNASTLMKTHLAVKDDNSVPTAATDGATDDSNDTNDAKGILKAEGQFAFKDADQSKFGYYYVYGSAADGSNNTEFAFFVCSEDAAKVFVDGTPDAVSEINSLTIGTLCPTSVSSNPDASGATNFTAARIDNASY